MVATDMALANTGPRLLAQMGQCQAPGAVEPTALPLDPLGQLARLNDLMRKDPQAAQDLAALAVERVGPLGVLRAAGGWRCLSMLLGNQSMAGEAIMAWRDGVLDEIEWFVSSLPDGIDKAGSPAVRRTGTVGRFSNDLDIAVLGVRSSANRDAVRAFVARRLGVEEGQLEELLLANFFTDPRRLHLYDCLVPEQRGDVAKECELKAASLIFARALYDAARTGNDALVLYLESLRVSLGIERRVFRPLDPAACTDLNARIDGLHEQLEYACAAGDSDVQRELVQEIIGAQVLISATEREGYYSGGAIKQLVTGPEGLANMDETLLQVQRFTALLDQLPKLYAEASTLLQLGFWASEDVVGAIKGIAKYGNRFRQLIKALQVQVADELRWDALAQLCQMLLRQAKGETDVTLLQRLAVDPSPVEREVRWLLKEFAVISQDVLDRLGRCVGLIHNRPAHVRRAGPLGPAGTSTGTPRSGSVGPCLARGQAKRFRRINPVMHGTTFTRSPGPPGFRAIARERLPTLLRHLRSRRPHQ